MNLEARKAPDLILLQDMLLFIVKDAEVYKSRIQPVIAMLGRRVANKTFDHQRSLAAWRYVVIDGAKRYAADANLGIWHKTIDADERLALAEKLSRYYTDNIQAAALRFAKTKKN